MEFPAMMRSSPHGAHTIYLIEDNEAVANRIYEIHDQHGHATPLLGSELASIVEWWKREAERKPTAKTA
jgi:hypothetical protein